MSWSFNNGFRERHVLGSKPKMFLRDKRLVNVAPLSLQ
jgi:hypothetical protein